MDDRLINPDEKVLYTISLIISLLTYLLLIFSLVGIFYVLLIVLITLFLHGLSIAHIRNNGVKVTERQFSEIYHRAQKIASEMGIKLPEIFITESSGVLNAFAASFLGRKFIVLYSDIVEISKEGYSDELDFIIAHELAHIQRNHVTNHLLILPARWVPFLANAYSRACEFTCDRIATAYINNAKASTNALTILAVGKILFTDVDTKEYIERAKEESGFFTSLSHLLSTHPPLPQRIEKVQSLKETLNLVETSDMELSR